MVLLTTRPKDRIILGLMTIGPDSKDGARITSQDEYSKILDTFQQQGYNEVDTARVYCAGNQEAFTREAKWQERGLQLATKCYPFEPGMHSPQRLRETLETSLKELGASTVDIFYLHAADRSVPFEVTLAEVDKLHKEGKFVQLGLSNFTAFEVAEVALLCRQHGWVRPTIYQGMYNAITRQIEGELIPACRRYGLDIVVYNPLAGGLFSGKVKRHETPEEGRFSTQGNKTTGERYRERYFRDTTFDALDLIQPVVEKHNLTLLETALRWVVHHSALKIKDGGNDGVIIGISSLQQLEGNLADFEKGPLPEEVVKALDDAWIINRGSGLNYWHMDLKYTYDTREALK